MNKMTCFAVQDMHLKRKSSKKVIVFISKALANEYKYIVENFLRIQNI